MARPRGNIPAGAEHFLKGRVGLRGHFEQWQTPSDCPVTLTAVLFADGESRRMGVDKATVTIAGEQLWKRQPRVLRKLQPHPLWISARTRSGWCPPEIKVVLDGPPSRGPLSGLAAALKHLTTQHLPAPPLIFRT